MAGPPFLQDLRVEISEWEMLGEGDYDTGRDWSANRGGSANPKPMVWEADDEERAKRMKRMDRFSKAAPAAATDTAGDAAPAADDEEKRSAWAVRAEPGTTTDDHQLTITDDA
eukprot:Skav210808  [mRNA]  locus=scaffold2924:69341:74982:- [translate_table: standard]